MIATATFVVALSDNKLQTNCAIVLMWCECAISRKDFEEAVEKEVRNIRLFIVGFKIETYWKKQKHIKGDSRKICENFKKSL